MEYLNADYRPFSDFTKKYQFEREIGSGSFGTVKLFRDKSGVQWAIKEIQITGLTPYAMGLVNTELKIMQKINYNYILRAHEAYISADKVAVVCEYAPHGNPMSSLFPTISKSSKIIGSLENYVKQNGGYLQGEKAIPLMKMTMVGLSKLQREGIIHRDIKPANILIGVGPKVLIGDFGLWY